MSNTLGSEIFHIEDQDDLTGMGLFRAEVPLKNAFEKSAVKQTVTFL